MSNNSKNSYSLGESLLQWLSIINFSEKQSQLFWRYDIFYQCVKNKYDYYLLVLIKPKKL